MPEGSSILRHYLTQADMFRQMAVPLLDQYVDWRTGQCAFDSDGFRELLLFLASFPDEFQTLLSQNALYDLSGVSIETRLGLRKPLGPPVAIV